LLLLLMLCSLCEGKRWLFLLLMLCSLCEGKRWLLLLLMLVELVTITVYTFFSYFATYLKKMLHGYIAMGCCFVKVKS
jgi:hypothetical protein